MVKETMTIHGALRELKTLDNRISSGITNIDDIVKAVPISDKTIGSDTIESWENRKKGDWESVVTLIKRRNAIKQKISESNASVKIVVKSYSSTPITVAAAIDLQKYGLDYYRTIIDTLKRSYRLQSDYVTTENTRADKDATIFAGNITSNLNNEKSGVSSEQINNVYQTYYDNHKWVLRDPINVLDKIKKLEEFVAAVEVELDSQLSVCNAMTLIEVEY